jgi:antitoxin component YwqK of YwqJK toxin-antitoxin module
VTGVQTCALPIYKRGLLHGVSTDYWNNGQKRNEVNWKKGSKHGISEHFNRKGKLIEKYVSKGEGG